MFNLNFYRQLIFRIVHRRKLGKHIIIDNPEKIILHRGSSVGHFSTFITCKNNISNNIELGENSKISNSCHVLSSGGAVIIGNNSFIGGHSVLLGGGGITIGHNVLISYHACICSSSHQTETNLAEGIYRNDTFAPITIEDNVFIGANTTLLMGITIGKDVVIGAGSVVTKNIPPRQIWAGNPAKKIKEIM